MSLAPKIVRATPQVGGTTAAPRRVAVAPASQPGPSPTAERALDLTLDPTARQAPAFLRSPTLRDTAAPREGPFVVNLAVDVPLTIGGLLAATIPMGVTNGPASEERIRGLSAARVNRLDRGVVGNHSRAAGHVSDALLVSALTLPYAAGLVDLLISRHADGLGGLGRDSLVLAETFAVSALACRLVKLGVRRPRPYAYDVGTPLAERVGTEATLSFYSGHTAWAFSMATSYSYLFSLRHPGSPWVPVVWASTHVAAATTGVMRVLAGKHFWSDVLVGAAVGSSIGFLVPWLHRTRRKPRPRDDWTRYARNLRVIPDIRPGGAGLTALTFW